MMKTRTDYEIRKKMRRLFRRAETCGFEETQLDDAERTFNLGVRLVVWLAATGKNTFDAHDCLSCPAFDGDGSRVDAVLSLLCAIRAIAWDVEERMECGEEVFNVTVGANLSPA